MHDEIRHRQARRAADGMDVDHVGQPPPAALLSALAVPDDPLDEKINGFFGVDSGAWFADFCGGSMDMSTRAGVALLEMLLDGESSSAAEGASRAEADGTRPAVEAMSVLSPSLSSSDDDEDDDDHWRYSSSESEDDAADEHWLPSESSSKNSATGSGKKRRRLPRRQQQQQSAAATGQRKLQQTDSVVVVEGGSSGGGNKDGYWCRRCDKVETPLWRAGPEGPKTLCNACGLRYKNGLAAMAAPQTKTSATKRLPTAAKPGGRSAKCKNRPVSASTVLRKKR